MTTDPRYYDARLQNIAANGYAAERDAYGPVVNPWTARAAGRPASWEADAAAAFEHGRKQYREAARA